MSISSRNVDNVGGGSDMEYGDNHASTEDCYSNLLADEPVQSDSPDEMLMPGEFTEETEVL